MELEHDETIIDSIHSVVEHVKTQIETIEKAITDLMNSDEQLAKKAKLLESIPGESVLTGKGSSRPPLD